MGGDSSVCSGESGLEFPTGTENELLRIRGGAQLWLIDGEESVLMQAGDLAFRVIKQTQSPLAAMVALVADLQWPVGRDSPALKVGNRRYAFALPGLLYGLALPVNAPAEAIQGLEGLLQQYSAFEMHPEISDGADLSKQSWLLQVRQQQEADFWTAVAPEVEKLSSKIARRIGGGSPYLWSDMEFGISRLNNNKNVNANPGHDPVGEQAISLRMTKRIQQGRRMSAVAKLLSKTLLRGAISANRHVAGAGEYLGDSNTSPPGADPNNSNSLVAVAGVDAFAKVVEAVEAAGRGLFEVAAAAEMQELQQKHKHSSKLGIEDHQADIGDVWTLNKSGLRLLLRATAASAMIHAGASFLSSGLSHQGSIPGGESPPSDEKEKYTRLVHHPAHFIPTPDSNLNSNSNSEALLQSGDSVCSARPPPMRGPHRSNSPFQQYSRPMPMPLPMPMSMDDHLQPPSHFHFSLGIDANNRLQQPQQHHDQQSL